MNLYQSLKSDRIGPDIVWTHWLLHFSLTARYLAKTKLKEIGVNSSLRPYVTIVGGKNIKIGRNVTVRPFGQLHAGINSSITIEDDVLLAPGVFITTNSHNYSDIYKPINLQGGDSKPVLIKQGAWVAANAVILSGVVIGRNSVVAAGAVVNKDVPDFCLVGGVPAKVLKRLNENE